MAASEVSPVLFPDFKSALDEIAGGTVSAILPDDLQQRMKTLIAAGLKSFALTIPLHAKVLHFAREMSEKRVLRHVAAIYSHLFHWMEQLSRIPAGALRAQRVHDLIDLAIQKSGQLAPPEQKVSCRKGCSFCCHTRVSASSSEGALIISHMEAEGLSIDAERLALQKDIQSPEIYARGLSWQDSACVFLNDEGACRIYPIRPATCRKHSVVSDPQLCDPHEANRPDYLVHLEAEIIASALYNIELGEQGDIPSLPEIIWQQTTI